MSASARKGIFDAIITAFQGITVAGGYNSNLGAKVFRWRNAPLDESEDYGLFVSWESDSRPDVDSATVHHVLTVRARIVVKDGASTEATLDKMEEDVVKVIETNYTWGGLAYNTDGPTSEPLMEQHAEKIGGMDITFTVNYRTTRRA